MKTTEFKNPILHGFYPDPSICFAQDSFYLVNSTFSYFPGIPVFKSYDLVHWKQIGNAIDRNSQITLIGNDDNEGVYAPTIRYYAGKFYIIADHETKVNQHGMFVITADDPAGPWSDPIYIKGADGIDPSLFIENGEFYFTATHSNSHGSNFFGDNEIYLAKLDPKNFQFVSEKIPLWRGALRKVAWPEGPHLYKHNGYYYLLIAEAGTEIHHAITVARSKKIMGPYEGCPNNPIMTHRFLGKDYPIKNVGHGDFVKTPLGDWYFVCLASRQQEGYVTTGRETFLGQVQWEDNWPVLNPGHGILQKTGTVNLEPNPFLKHIKKIGLNDLRLIYLRNPDQSTYVEDKEKIVLKGTKSSLSELNSPTYLAVRESSMNSYFGLKFENLHLADGKFGIGIYQNHQHYITFTIVNRKNNNYLEIEKVVDDNKDILWSQQISFIPTRLIVKQCGLELLFGYFNTDSNNFIWINKNVDARELSTEVAGGFLGTTFGAYLFGAGNIVNLIEIDTSNSYEE